MTGAQWALTLALLAVFCAGLAIGLMVGTLRAAGRSRAAYERKDN